ETFKTHHVHVVTLVGGEPMLRQDIIKVFCDEMPRRVCVVTNGTYPLTRFDNLYFYWISLDGTEKVHDSIRGKGSYLKTKKNIMEYIKGPNRNGKPAWKDIWISMTINSLNYTTIEELVNEWNGVINKIRFPNFVMNTKEQLELMKGNWGGVKTSPINCPTWAILSLDHKGKVKQPCCIGSSDSKALKPICEKCGLGCYSILVAQGIKNK